MNTTKEYLVITAKSLRQRLDSVLQEMKQHKSYLTDRTLLESHLTDHQDHGESIANLVLSIRDCESSIMRLGMVLKNTGNPNPYPESYNPTSTAVEPTSDGLKL